MLLLSRSTVVPVVPPGTHPLAKHEEQMVLGKHFSATSAHSSEGLQPIGAKIKDIGHFCLRSLGLGV